MLSPTFAAGATACTHPSIRLSVCFVFLFPFHFPALTPPVSAVCSARRAGQPRNRRWRPQWTSSTTHPPLRFSRPSRRRAAPCSSYPVTRAKPLISSMRSKSLTENMWCWGTPISYLTQKLRSRTLDKWNNRPFIYYLCLKNNVMSFIRIWNLLQSGLWWDLFVQQMCVVGCKWCIAQSMFLQIISSACECKHLAW